MTLVRGRGWAYFGATLGGAVSIAANVAHSYVPPAGPDGTRPPADWAPDPGAVVGAIFWPVALLVAVEILARVVWPAGRGWALLRFGGLLPVALVAALVSYRHLSGLLAHYGEDSVTTALGPLAVDGLMLMATGALIATGRRPAPADGPPPVVRWDYAEPIGPPRPPVVDEPGPPPVDPWQYAVPIGPEPVPDPVEPVAEPVREPVSRPRVTARSLTAADRVRAAHGRYPDATHERIAQLAGCSVTTVKRWRPARPVTGPPSGPAPAETAPTVPEDVPLPGMPEPINGTRSELMEANR